MDRMMDKHGPRCFSLLAVVLFYMTYDVRALTGNVCMESRTAIEDYYVPVLQSYSSPYYTSCGFFWVSRCVRYRTRYRYVSEIRHRDTCYTTYKCCPGWRTDTSGTNCSIPTGILDQIHTCDRNCRLSQKPLVCNYTFKLESYQSMSKACMSCGVDNIENCTSPDCIPLEGTDRYIMAVNRMIPGPQIKVCKGDTVNVTVMNHFDNGESTSVHWHGPHQHGTQYMDGVAGVTQCPIPPFTSFTYKFLASPSGTHWWHAHSGLQRAEGLFGALIIRDPVDSYKEQYGDISNEHIMIVHDWFRNQSALHRFAHTFHTDGSYANNASAILINGKGSDNNIFLPRENFLVQSKQTYRFRVISNGITNCPLKISIDNHTLDIIATDGRPVQRLQVDAIVIYSGERYDFLLVANRTPSNYWIRAVAYNPTDRNHSSGKLNCDLEEVKGLAILHYDGAECPHDYQHVNSITGSQNVILNTDLTPITHLNSLENNGTWTNLSYSVQHILNVDFNNLLNDHFDPHHNGSFSTPHINGISFSLGQSPLLIQSQNVKTCNETYNDCSDNTTVCSCTHVIDIKSNDIVQLVLTNYNDLGFDVSHPMHLHGQNFYVLAMEALSGPLNESVVLDHFKSKYTHLTDISNKVLKDTVIIPRNGYIVIRFKASNPGYWFFHCHIEFHLETGLFYINCLHSYSHVSLLGCLYYRSLPPS